MLIVQSSQLTAQHPAPACKESAPRAARFTGKRFGPAGFNRPTQTAPSGNDRTKQAIGLSAERNTNTRANPMAYLFAQGAPVEI
jgi:hypothetical protein